MPFLFPFFYGFAQASNTLLLCDVSSPLGIRARIGMICCGCELEISGILLTMDLRVMDMSEFDVILGMDWLTAYRVVIDCEHRRVTAYTQDGTPFVFQGDKHDIFPQTV